MPELKGKTLACYCHPKKCHGHNIIDLYNELVKDDGTVDMIKYEGMRVRRFMPVFYWTGDPDIDAEKINRPHIETEGENEDRIGATLATLMGGARSISLDDALNIQNALLSKNNWKGIKPGLRQHEVSIKKPSGFLEKTPLPSEVPGMIRSLFPVKPMPKEKLLAWYTQVQTVHPLSDLNGRVFGIIVSILHNTWNRENGN